MLQLTISECLGPDVYFIMCEFRVNSLICGKASIGNSLACSAVEAMIMLSLLKSQTIAAKKKTTQKNVNADQTHSDFTPQHWQCILT
jgi:hypothetical protein